MDEFLGLWDQNLKAISKERFEVTMKFIQSGKSDFNTYAPTPLEFIRIAKEMYIPEESKKITPVALVSHETMQDPRQKEKWAQIEKKAPKWREKIKGLSPKEQVRYFNELMW
jgi:hypothetical protein